MDFSLLKMASMFFEDGECGMNIAFVLALFTDCLILSPLK